MLKELLGEQRHKRGQVWTPGCGGSNELERERMQQGDRMGDLTSHMSRRAGWHMPQAGGSVRRSGETVFTRVMA